MATNSNSDHPRQGVVVVVVEQPPQGHGESGTTLWSPCPETQMDMGPHHEVGGHHGHHGHHGHLETEATGATLTRFVSFRDADSTVTESYQATGAGHRPLLTTLPLPATGGQPGCPQDDRKQAPPPPQQQLPPPQQSTFSHATSNGSGNLGHCPQPRTLRPHSTPATLLWLEENYEIAEGVCIPRSALYMHYVDFCARNSIQPVNAASFGKIIRQQFPQLTTRRLGTRGQSRYHYYGIAVRETSLYFQLAYSRKAVSSSSAADSAGSGGSKSSSCRDSSGNAASSNKQNSIMGHSSVPGGPGASSNLYHHHQDLTNCGGRSTGGPGASGRLGVCLPDFPNLKDIRLPATLDPIKTATFLVMYRTHCQRVLDTVTRANFEEVQSLLLHFWRGVPPHLAPLLGSNAFIALVSACDCILYKAIATVLLPSLLQSVPDSLAKIIRKFAAELDYWLKMAMYLLPEAARTVKVELSRRFGRMLRRQASMSHLAQAARMVVSNGEVLAQMAADWRLLDMELICRDAVSMANDNAGGGGGGGGAGGGSGGGDQVTFINNDRSIQVLRSACRSFEKLLEEEAAIEGYLEWLDTIVQQCVVYPAVRSKSSMRRLASHFYVLWSALGSRLVREMTAHAVPSFGSFHLLRLMFDDYVLYLVEYVNLEEQTNELLSKVPTDESPYLTPDSWFPEAIAVEAEPSPYVVGPGDQVGPSGQGDQYCCLECGQSAEVCHGHEGRDSYLGADHGHHGAAYADYDHEQGRRYSWSYPLSYAQGQNSSSSSSSMCDYGHGSGGVTAKEPLQESHQDKSPCLDYVTEGQMMYSQGETSTHSAAHVAMKSECYASYNYL